MDDNVLVGIETSEDAGIYKLSDEVALVQTADFITPVVDDPFVYGQIAVANALSDVYAMGGRPLTAINLVMFDACRVPMEYLKEILRGGISKLKEAGVSLIGGHTVDDLETKYGLSVTGIVHPKKFVRNSTAKPGDVLIYTKPLGIGVLTTAIKAGMASQEEIEEVSEVMTTLNKYASEAMVEVGVNACTDITGFGFLGHLYEMVKFSGVGAVIYSEKLRFLEGAKEYAAMGLLPAATYDNVDYVGNSVRFSDSVDEDTRMLLFDPQTSGGLLIAVPEERTELLIERLKEKGVKWIQEAGKIKEGNLIEVV
ncbi:selenophosphate synthase [Phorcysia thermohydrogeniphila]|uniref:Selenide, water dikinase n=1 Tax=Phorcysia thermohydrogeniphila TaxID=936138 RepID=A0A4R1GCY1_9BACT|nr:selenophosphate synthase [Phorcysia thermohydrogeniphila]